MPLLLLLITIGTYICKPFDAYKGLALLQTETEPTQKLFAERLGLGRLIRVIKALDHGITQW